MKIRDTHDYLMHYGILGQKWGVRRGPPYPIENKVLKKGTKINSVSSFNNSKDYINSGRMIYTYNPKDKHDVNVYEGAFTVNRMLETQNLIYRHRFKVASDLKMPTQNERIQYFIDLYKNSSKESIGIYAKELNKAWREGKEDDPELKKVKDPDFSNLQSKSDYLYAYGAFVTLLDSPHNYALAKDYINKMSKSYDAMVDDNDVSYWNNAHDPVIIFNPDKVLRIIGNAKEITVEEATRKLLTLT